MKPVYESLRFCPRCGARYGPDAFDPIDVRFTCRTCGYDYYQNSVPSIVAIVPSRRDPTSVLMLTRSNEPAAGKIALPGGFLRYNERPADGVRREVLEETACDVTVDRLLGETILAYPYGGGMLSVLEIAFVTLPIDAELGGISTEEASTLQFADASELIQHAEALAFPEHQSVLSRYLHLLETA
jgi:ADP-ribose pyrophosphatase YjhB (NUDIX family)